MPTSPVIVWFRRDLRLNDNLAVDAALRSGQPVFPVFVLDPVLTSGPAVSLPRLAFLLKALGSLDQSLHQCGSRLFIYRGNPRQVLPSLVNELGATALYYNRDYSPLALRRDRDVTAALTIPQQAFDDALLLPPGSVLTDAGMPYTVFTPFKKKWVLLPKPSEVSLNEAGGCWVAPDQPAIQSLFPLSIPLALADLGRSPSIPVPAATEVDAKRRLAAFLSARVYSYGKGRHQLAASADDDTVGSTSFLSPYLRFGLLSPRQAYWGARQAYAGINPNDLNSGQAQSGVETWVSELIWREFYMHILFHFPHVLSRSFRPEYDHIEWRSDPDEFERWKLGLTGFPVVDAAMRQLKAMGWMPNRARMIVASFLTKDLLISWREGERHFMEWLIDGDPAANNGGWQWTAGTGTDAQPYFRIFNPVQQSIDFDPDGIYIRRWVPELRDVPPEHLHTPWEWGRVATTYGLPMVDRKMARERALVAFKAVRT